MNLNVDALRQKATKPVKKWPKWYIESINEHLHTLVPEERKIAHKASKLFKESVDNGVIMTKHKFHNTPLPTGYIYKADELLNEAISLYESLNINK